MSTRYVFSNKEKVLILILGISIPCFLGLGYLWGNYQPQVTSGFNPIIDGIIESGWDSADYKLTTYAIVNGSDGNVDAINYLYVYDYGDNITIAIDIVSKQNSSTENEWIGLWFETLGQEFGYNLENDFLSYNFGWTDATALLGNGLDCLVYDINNSEPFSFIKSTGTPLHKDVDIEELDVDLTSGIIHNPHVHENPNVWESTEELGEGDMCIVTSEEEIIDMDIKDHILINASISIQNLFPYVPATSLDELIASMDNILLNYSIIWAIGQNEADQFDILGIYDETTLEKCDIWIENNGTINTSQMDLFSANEWMEINPQALENGYLNFSIEVYNSSLPNPYDLDLWIDYLQFTFDYEGDYDGLYGTSTIENYSIAVGFGTSPNCEIPHRMIEVSFEKEQLTDYTDSVNVFIEGGGMAKATNPIDYNLGTAYEFYLNARRLIRNFAFTSGTLSFGDWFGSQYGFFWDTYCPIWNKNYYNLTF